MSQNTSSRQMGCCYGKSFGHFKRLYYYCHTFQDQVKLILSQLRSHVGASYDYFDHFFESFRQCLGWPFGVPED